MGGSFMHCILSTYDHLMTFHLVCRGWIICTSTTDSRVYRSHNLLGRLLLPIAPGRHIGWFYHKRNSRLWNGSLASMCLTFLSSSRWKLTSHAQTFVTVKVSKFRKEVEAELPTVMAENFHKALYSKEEEEGSENERSFPRL